MSVDVFLSVENTYPLRAQLRHSGVRYLGVWIPMGLGSYGGRHGQAKLAYGPSYPQASFARPTQGRGSGTRC